MRRIARLTFLSAVAVGACTADAELMGVDGLAMAVPQAGSHERSLGPRVETWSIAFEAFAEIVLLDHAFGRCVDLAWRGPRSDPENPYRTLRACLHRQEFPADCRSYVRSVENAAELVVARNGLAPLAPAALAVLSACREGAGAPPPDDQDRTESQLSVVERLLGRPASPDPSPIGDVISFPPNSQYLSELCPLIVENRLPDVRMSELLLCSDQGHPDSEFDRYRVILRRQLELP